MPSLKPVSWLPLLLPFALAACDSGQPSYSASNSTPPPPAAAAQPAPPPTPAPPATAPEQPVAAAAPAPAAASAGDRRSAPAMQPTAHAIRLPPAEQVGIGACDDYVSRYRACLESDSSGLVAAPQRRYQLSHQLARQVRQWKLQLAKDAKNGDIARACSEASTQARETLGKSGCKSF